MAKTGLERMQSFRERRKSKGYRQVSILIDPETAHRLDRMKAKHNQSIDAMFSEALKYLEAQKGEKGGVLRKKTNWRK